MAPDVPTAFKCSFIFGGNCLSIQNPPTHSLLFAMQILSSISVKFPCFKIPRDVCQDAFIYQLYNRANTRKQIN